MIAPARGDSPIRAVNPDALVAELAEWCLTGPTGSPLRVAVDGAPAAQPQALAPALAEHLRAQGRPCGLVDMNNWLRPASLRLERGRQDAVSFRDAWFDYSALRREVLDPLGPAGTGQWIPTLWDPETDRASRAPSQHAAPEMVLLVAGPMLLGRDLPFDLGIHLHLSPSMLRRRTPAEMGWTVDVLLEHEQVADSDTLAEVVVRADHPERPAVCFR